MGATIKNSDIVYQDLRRAIVDMTMTPGTPVNEKELTQRYGISRTPVREAVLRLAEDGLVDVVPKSGTFVSRIPLSRVREALVARQALEAVTVREATARATESQLMEMRALIQRQREAVECGDDAAFHEADNAFHAAIAVAARLGGIWDMIEQFRVQNERYRRLTLPQEGRMEMVLGEHEAVLDAMERGDADAAAELMVFHLNKLKVEFAVFHDIWPDYFLIDPVADSDLLAN